MNAPHFMPELRKLRPRQEGAIAETREALLAWPNDPRVRCAEPTPPSLNTRNWLKSRAIAFAKRRAA